MVKVRYVAYLAHIYGKKEERVRVTKPVRVRDLVDPERAGSMDVIILVNGRRASWDTQVNDDDEVVLIPPVSGGGPSGSAHGI